MADDRPELTVLTGTRTSSSSVANYVIAGGDPVVVVNPIVRELQDLNSPLPQELERQDSAATVLATLRDRHPPHAIEADGAPREWELAGLYFINRVRLHEALGVLHALYHQMLLAQEAANKWIHKGLPLVWISDCYQALGYPVHARRYLMLTLCEDAIRSKGVIVPEEGGVYYRAVWRYGITDEEFHRLAQRFYALARESESSGHYPEALLLELGSDWQTETPSALESGTYVVNPLYMKHLMKQMGDGTGQAVEHLAQYLMDCMPGCRTLRRARSHSTDYDLVCTVEGFEVDFRAEFGRYFLCECKDWQGPADFPAIAKFCRVLDSVKARFGVLFSKNGVTGQQRTTDSAREILKYFQDSGKVITVVSQTDLESVAQGYSFLRLLRAKYEAVRLDLTPGKQES